MSQTLSLPVGSRDVAPPIKYLKQDVLREHKLYQLYIVAVKRGGALCRVRIYCIKPCLEMYSEVKKRYPHPDSDQHQN